MAFEVENLLACRESMVGWKVFLHSQLQDHFFTKISISLLFMNVQFFYVSFCIRNIYLHVYVIEIACMFMGISFMGHTYDSMPCFPLHLIIHTW